MVNKIRPSAGSPPEPGIEPIHSFLLRQPTAVYATFLGVALAAILLAVAFASGGVDVGVPRWLWLVDLLIVVSFLVDHLRVAISRRRAPTSSMLCAAVPIAGALIGLTLFVCW
jgi:hypothetical protein